MGRYYFDKKAEADQLKKIDISWLKKKGFLSGSHPGIIKWTVSGIKSSIGIDIETMGDYKHARLYYTQTDEAGRKSDYDYDIELVTTSCNYGGERYWFICPLHRSGKGLCDRRVRVLYKGGSHFGCRHCYDLTYSSRNESSLARHHPAFRRIVLDDKIEKLEGEIKTPYYAGRPTRKQRRLNNMYEKL